MIIIHISERNRGKENNCKDKKHAVQNSCTCDSNPEARYLKRFGRDLESLTWINEM